MSDDYQVTNNLFVNVAFNFVERNFSNVVEFLAENGRKVKDVGKQNDSVKEYIDSIFARSSKIKSYYFRDEPANFYDFFVPLDVIVGGDTFERVDFKKISFINNSLVISGAGGCGKSILMRHLFLSGIAIGNKIPIFFELRELNNSDAELEATLRQYFKNHIRYQDNKSFLRCLEEGKFVFFLDGFDEIALEKKEAVASELLAFTQQYNSCQFLISSRPDNIFQG